MSFENLNEKQQEAVKHIEGPLLILAGAGSGKTSTMTHRIAHMVEQGISQYNILAVTFTNKAAAEMRTRVEDLIGPCNDMWIMTFHAMCLRILRVYPEIIGYQPNFVIYDTQDQKTLVKNILKANGISDREFSPQYLLAIISNSKEKSLDADSYKNDVEDNYKTKAIYTVFKAYENELKKNNAMNMDGLSEATIEKLINKGLIKEFADLFRISEFRDAIVEMEGFGDKSFDNLVASVEKSKDTTPERLLYALGIPGIGVANAKLIARACHAERTGNRVSGG